MKIDVLVMKCLATQITGTEITGQKSADQDRYILLYKHLISNIELLQKEIVLFPGITVRENQDLDSDSRENVGDYYMT